MFSFKGNSPKHLDAYLQFLEVRVVKNDLVTLNKLIAAHQEKVPFENLSRVVDFHTQENFLPPIELWIERLYLDYGGVCWTLARGFGWLLYQLGYETDYLYMDPGHVCLKVKLDQDYYVDVGYGAPFFQAFLLRSSFLVKTPWESFSYAIDDERVPSGALVVRTPGPTKNLSFTSVSSETIAAHFHSGNRWKENRFLSMLTFGRFLQQRPLRIAGDKVSDYRGTTPIESTLDPLRLPADLKIPPELWKNAQHFLSQS